MNTNTRKELIQLIDVIEKLSAAVLPFIGLQTAAEVANQCHATIRALENDDTITESGIGSGPVSN